MTGELVRYDAACRAVAEAKTLDEVKDFHDKAEAMRAYARQAQNKQLEVDAAEIRIRAERRLGEILADTPKATGARGVGPNAVPSEYRNEPTLSEIGVGRKLSSRAQKLAAVPETQFESMVGDWRGRIEEENERVTTNLLKAGEKSLSRDAREQELARNIAEASETLGEKQYGVIYADPPWRFEPYSRETGMDRAADNHYPTMTLDAIEALDVPSANDCVLFLWATAPMLPQAMSVMGSWGFEYKSQIVWVKDRIGTGYWARNKHELLLIGTRGNVPAPEPGTQPNSIIEAPISKHSAKPKRFAEVIEFLFPNLPRIELFARAERDGWDCWGAEAPH